jgi:CHAD domain-containing protein
MADPEQRPKLFRALDLAPPPPPVVVTPGTPPVVALALSIAEQRRRLALHDPGTRLGSDPEELHQLRVATRRLRAILRTGRPLLERAWADELRAELGWLGSALGPARDLDVLVERIGADVATLGGDADVGQGLLVQLEAERALARAAVGEALTSPRYFALLDRLDAAAADPALSGTEVPLATIAVAAWRRARKEARVLPDRPSDDELHALRIAIKRARYAAELANHELGRKGSVFVQAAKDAQDVLGEHQDACVAEERIRAWAEGAAGGALAAGRLVQLERDRRAAMRAAWPTTWRALHAAGRRLK